MNRRRITALLTPSLAAGLTYLGEAIASGPSPRSAARLASCSARTLAFWAAVVLPFVHVAVLLGGLDTPTELAVFGVLLGSNLLALVLGHEHATR